VRSRAASAALLLAALAGCGGGSPVEQVSLAVRIEAIEAEIRTRIGPAACIADADCGALPLGALACGGPSRFVPYSVRATDEGALSSLGEDHRRLSAELLAGRAAVGPCVALAPPVAYCERLAPLACRLR